MSTTLTDLNGTYVIDPAHSTIGFVARHAMITKVRGSFPAFEGAAQLDGQNPAASSVQVTLDVASVSTGNADRDAHLASADFFDAAQFPKITFASTATEVTGPSTFELTGELTIKGTTRPVVIPFGFTGSAKDPFGNERAGFEGEVEVNRKDFGLSWNAALETGGVLVSEKVKLVFEVSTIKQS